MNESFRHVRHRAAYAEALRSAGAAPRSGRVSVRVVFGVALALVMTAAVVLLEKRSGGAIGIRPRPSRGAVASAAERSSEQRLRRPAPVDEQDRDAGVAEASREFASELVAPDLRHPESAVFPPETIRFERAVPLNFFSEGRMEHWLVDGSVDSRNDHGVTVRSRWRLLIARADDELFPVLAALEGVEVYYLRSHGEMLLEARQAALQERNDEAAGKKRRQLAELEALRRSIEAVRPIEDKAQAALKLAVDLLNAGRDEAGRRRLQEIIDRFPGTNAAARAEELLAK